MIFVFDGPGAPAVVPRDSMGAALAAIGIDHDRWPVRPVGDGPDAELEAWRHELDALIARHGYQSVDVVRMTPDHPQREAARAKFLAEHTHADDETRFFAAGSGVFYLHVEEKVYAVHCTAGDLLRVPAGTRHWFDMGAAPSFVAIRLFTRPDGWVAEFTGSPVAGDYPDFDALTAR